MDNFLKKQKPMLSNSTNLSRQGLKRRDTQESMKNKLYKDKLLSMTRNHQLADTDM